MTQRTSTATAVAKPSTHRIIPEVRRGKIGSCTDNEIATIATREAHLRIQTTGGDFDTEYADIFSYLLNLRDQFRGMTNEALEVMFESYTDEEIAAFAQIVAEKAAAKSGDPVVYEFVKFRDCFMRIRDRYRNKLASKA